MKYALPLGASAIMLAVFALTARHSLMLMNEDPGALIDPLNNLTAQWQEQNTPVSQRLVDLVLADTRSGPDPTTIPMESAWPQTAADWITSRVIGGNPAETDSTTLASAFKKERNAVVWTHAGYSKVSKERTTREIVKAVMIAAKAGAQINIIVQGEAADAALEALRRIQAAGAKDWLGRPITVAKVVLLGYHKPNLVKPPNALEVAQIYKSGLGFEIQTTKIALLESEGYREAPLDELKPALATLRAADPDYASVVDELISSPQTIDQLMGGRQTLPQAPVLAQPAPRPAAAQDRQDSLSMLQRETGGAPPAAQEPQDSVPMDAPIQKPGQVSTYHREGLAIDCCLESKGAWSHGKMPTDQHVASQDRAQFQQDFGCCSLGPAPGWHALPDCQEVMREQLYQAFPCVNPPSN